MPTLDHLFSVAGDIVVPVWLLLMFAPQWRWTQRAGHLRRAAIVGRALWVSFAAREAGRGCGFSHTGSGFATVCLTGGAAGGLGSLSCLRSVYRGVGGA